MQLSYSNYPWQRYFNRILVLPTLVSAIAFTMPSPLKSQPTSDGRALTVKAQIQEANSKTGVVTARGNVEMFYPARKIQATAAQAQYFSRERRIVLSGNVYVLQEGNSIQGETVTYLIDEGRFIATPKTNGQVESIYIINDPNPTTAPQVAPATPNFNRKNTAKQK
jgi:lipopolysaccharide export system protein LptA